MVIKMKMMIDCDNTMPIQRQKIVGFFTSPDSQIYAQLPSERFHISGANVNSGADSKFYNDLYDLKEGGIDVVFLFTMTPYTNNFFFEGIDSVYVVSLAGWNQLTRVEIDVGIAYMICMISIKYVLGIGQNHDENVGCINDFLWDKSGIDAGMRAAYICDNCQMESKAAIEKHQKELDFFKVILDTVSDAARANKSIFETQSISESKPASKKYDVFLCHNSEDKEIVRELKLLLQEQGVSTWFDEDQVEPGDVWQDVLEDNIETVLACAIFVGESGLGPWQKKELRAFINEFADRDVLLIPILVGELQNIPDLPLFLKQFQYLDLRGDKISDFNRLANKLKSNSNH